ENFFRQVDSLDVYQHEYYPFYRSHQRRTVGIQFPPYYGNDYQTAIIDQRLLASYDQTRRALSRSGNTHTTLEVIIQAGSQFTYESDTTYFRRPTEAEIWLQAFLALGRGYKGVHTYVYRTVPYTGYFVPFDSGLVASTTPPTARTAINPYFDYVAQLYQHLAELGDDILPLTVLDAFTWTDTAHSYITDILYDVDDGGHGTIEISLMDHPSNNYDYFLLVNRRCSSDNNGTPAPPQTITVLTNKSGQYQIRDLYSGELFVTSNGYFRNITIGPGRGRLFELRPMFAANETWDTDTVNVSSSITVPSGKTLTIAPNSKVKFYTGQYLLVQGKLVANGTASQHIKFTAAAAANPTRGSFDNPPISC
ncbi:MAG: hypothetical protein ONB32_13025, partial [candidate division KSB1 bacterium]|nr:hypothetical protein [candidate division KSB1 bacterium]